MKAVLGSLALSLCTGAAVPNDVTAGFFPGRSGSVVVKSLDRSVKEGLAIFVDRSGRYFKETQPMRSSDIGDVVTRAFGVSPLNEGSFFAAQFVDTNMFDRPKCNLLISLESLSTDMVDTLGLHNLAKLRKQSSASMSFPSYPQDSVSEAASISTGRMPSEHGIVGSSWQENKETVHAFLEADAFSQTSTVADILSQTFQGQSLIVSASADAQQSLAYCSNYKLMAQHSDWNTFCLSLNPTTEEYQCVEPLHSIFKKQTEKNIRQSKQELVTALLSAESSVLAKLGDHVSAVVQGINVRVTFPGQQGESVSATYSLSSPEDFKLFAELQFAYLLPEILRKDAGLLRLVEDDVPDFFAFSAAALSSVGLKSGVDSDRMAGAAHLLDAALPAILQRYLELYPDRMVAEVLLPASQPRALSTSSKTLEAISNLVPQVNNLGSQFPQLNFNSATKLGADCKTLSDSLKSLNYVAYCPESTNLIATTGANKSVHANVAPYPGNNYQPNMEQIALFQVAFWTSVGLIAILLAAVCCLCNMSYKKDTLIYGSFNPEWNSRKRR
eukprot:g6280.t1